MNKSDELRSRLPQLAAEMYEQIGIALERIRREAARPTRDMADAAWAKGMADALRLLRGCAVAHGQFGTWLRDVVRQDPDQCGLTKGERETITHAA